MKMFFWLGIRNLTISSSVEYSLLNNEATATLCLIFVLELCAKTCTGPTRCLSCERPPIYEYKQRFSVERFKLIFVLLFLNIALLFFDLFLKCV